MNTMYCSHCGTKLSYSFEKPKFCSSCGSPTGPSTSRASTQIPEDTEEEVNIPSISKLDYQVDFDTSKVTLGSIIQDQLSHSPDGPGEAFKRPEVSTADKNKTYDDILKESLDMCRPRQTPQDLDEQK